jgi:hypothetical protein
MSALKPLPPFPEDGDIETVSLWIEELLSRQPDHSIPHVNDWMHVNKEIKIPVDASVLVLEDMEERIAWFRKRLGHARVCYSKTSRAAIHALQESEFTIVFLDHDLGFLDAADPTRPNSNGKEVARFLRESKFAGTVILHSLNPPARDIMARILPQAIIAPFGTFAIILI